MIFLNGNTPALSEGCYQSFFQSQKFIIMKNFAFLLLLAIVLPFLSCHHESQVEQVNKAAIEQEIVALMEDTYSVFSHGNFDRYASTLSDNGLFVGTDRTEFWNKVTVLEIQKQMFDDPDFTFSYKLAKRVIRVADSGQWALVIDQLEATSVFGPDLPVRLTSVVINTDDGWKIDYLGWGLIPDNEDLGKIAEVLAE
jgi:ketosteroid isomerase-like protein